MVSAIGIALTGLESATKRLNASAANIANLSTIGSLDAGGPQAYTPLTTTQSTVTDSAGNVLGVRSDYIPKNDPYSLAYIPSSYLANEEGLVQVPNVDLGEEFVNMKIAAATYKANLATIKVSDDLSQQLFRLLDEKA